MRELLHIALLVTLIWPLNSISQTRSEQSSVVYLDLSKKSVAFSDYAVVGKVSIFILSFEGCAPCKRLLSRYMEAFERKEIDKSTVQVYYCSLSGKTDSSSDWKNRGSFKNFQEVDQLTRVFPSTLIFAPTRNFYKMFEGEDFSEQMKIVSALSIATKRFFKASEHESSVGEPKFASNAGNAAGTQNQKSHTNAVNSNQPKVSSSPAQSKERESNSAIHAEQINDLINSISQVKSQGYCSEIEYKRLSDEWERLYSIRILTEDNNRLRRAKKDLDRIGKKAETQDDRNMAVPPISTKDATEDHE